jgi:hypothetical protein
MGAQLLTLAIAATTMLGPIAKDNSKWGNRVPEAIKADHGTSYFRMQISDSGKPEYCDTTKPSSDPKIDELLCDFLLKSTRFVPALDQNGKRIESFYEESSDWVISGGHSKIQILPDVTLTVDRLPMEAGSAPSLTVPVDIVVDTHRNVEACVAHPEIKSAKLASISCREAAFSSRPYALTRPEGISVRYFDRIYILFQTSATFSREHP